MKDTTKRIRIFTGMNCNAKCRMCYYLGRREDRPIENIRKQIDIAAECGMKTVDFSGGEPTIRKDLCEILAYAASKGLRTCIVTNGIRLADKEYIGDLHRNGLDEALVSVHGGNPEQHDYITQVPGSFEKMMQGINNIKELDIMLRTNTTITKINYLSLEQHANKFVEIQPHQSNFILFNDWDMASKVTQDMAIKYSSAAPQIKKAIDIMKKGGLKRINVRYIPFCFMNGYEEHVCDYPQKIYDPFEWSQELLSKFGETDSFNLKATIKHHLSLPYGVLVQPTFSKERAYAEVRRERCYIKPNKCRHCGYEPICDGLEKGYVKVNGTDELKPHPGRKIRDPLYYRADFYEGKQ